MSEYGTWMELSANARDIWLKNIQKALDYIRKSLVEPQILRPTPPTIVPPLLYEVLRAQKANGRRSNRHTRQAVRVAKQRWYNRSKCKRVPHKKRFRRAAWAEPWYYDDGMW